ncbi:MAG: NTP transferase domain-containing protein [Verrucomicrobiota bacterium]|nr:NTP transferase domain-containing protein [Verrucomicrobiota bacterium]
MSAIREAVILMAGSGSRLRSSQKTLPKPLTPVLGRPLISYTFEALTRAGITKIHVVVGYESDRLTAAVTELASPDLELSFVLNPEWQKQNGISLLTVAKNVSGNFVLTMSDHLFDSVIVDLLMKLAEPGVLNLAVDRKVYSIFDLGDAMKVQTRDDLVITIGKDLQKYDAIDTGLFVCPLEMFAYLGRAKENGDCSLADGVRLMAADKKVRAVDIGDAWWQDIDTVEMLQHAEKHMAEESNTKRLTK